MASISTKGNKTKQHTFVTKVGYSKRTLSQNKTQLFSRELKVMSHRTIRNDDF